ncbi:uncharacterized protein N7511_007359 [Penicillium nucicola]|uniref:uncharacterized protein n=1 Tax=Penicillium nucicola TaxID=1850975 RepID=UPI002545699A|nr:uncharacterized protein N7511_007359 [Penicillium nucicola]KAJ5757177.1 hypothetical protein N7511_007359 [Penicillium nucicola]
MYETSRALPASQLTSTAKFASQGIGSVQPPIQQEFTDIVQVSYSSVAYYVGLILGASFWGISSDLMGRKPAFNCTLLIAGVFLCAAAGSMNFVAFSALWAVIGTAAGGNVPVDSMIFLEFVPGRRYTLITLGGLALAFTFVRIFVFKLPETPRYLLSQGRDQEAVDAVNHVARQNGKPEPLTISMFQEIDIQMGNPIHEGQTALTTKEVVKENMQAFRGEHYRALFATRKLGRQTMIIWAIWLTVGIAYPLFFAFLPSYLATKFTENSSLYLTYRNYCITSAVGILGPLSAAVCVNTRLGRRWMMGISAVVTAVFLFAYVGVNSPAADLAFSSITSLLANFGLSKNIFFFSDKTLANSKPSSEYAIMYAFTPESFPAPHRGTGAGTAAALLRFGGLVASIISSQTGFTTAPIYASAALWVAVGVFCLGLPFETHGHDAL